MIFASAPGAQPKLDRPRREAGLERLLGWGRRVRRRHAWALVALALAVAGLVDGWTGTRAWMGPVYLLVIAFGTWSLGPRDGLCIGFACMAIGTAINGPDLYPSGSALLAWNYAMRIFAMTIIVALIGSIRRSFDREWQGARSDALTGLLNRQGFFDTLELRPLTGGPSLLAYLDLDDFKLVNDRFGHAAGDALLRDFAGAVAAEIGPAGLVARIGGDEFLLLLPAESERAAVEAAWRLHALVNGITRCSVGALIRGADAPVPSERDMQLADRLMYEGKSGGSGLRIGTADDLPRACEEPLQALAA
jgi:diguanylate cyclase (GGDEF)-like protein